MVSESFVPVSSTRLPQPPQELWRLVRQGAEWRCELRPFGQSGTEAVILRNGNPFSVRRFQLPEMAAMWAALEREEL
jgi:hypothetical protein